MLVPCVMDSTSNTPPSSAVHRLHSTHVGSKKVRTPLTFDQMHSNVFVFDVLVSKCNADTPRARRTPIIVQNNFVIRHHTGATKSLAGERENTFSFTAFLFSTKLAMHVHQQLLHSILRLHRMLLKKHARAVNVATTHTDPLTSHSCHMHKSKSLQVASMHQCTSLPSHAPCTDS
jgi:hypothetical protein